jgi:hypothetical protein
MDVVPSLKRLATAFMFVLRVSSHMSFPGNARASRVAVECPFALLGPTSSFALDLGPSESLHCQYSPNHRIGFRSTIGHFEATIVRVGMPVWSW